MVTSGWASGVLRSRWSGAFTCSDGVSTSCGQVLISSGAGYLFNYGWITLIVMFIIVIIGGLYESPGPP